MINYTWTIESVHVLQNVGTKNDVVKKVKFVLDGKRNEENHFIIGEVELTDPAENFIDFDQIAEDTMVGWIIDTLTQDVVDQYKEDITSRFTPEELVAKPLP